MCLSCAFVFAFLSAAYVTAEDSATAQRTAMLCKGLIEEYWTQWFDDKCYTLHPEELSWNHAKETCINMGGQLCKVESMELGESLLGGDVHRRGIYRNVRELVPDRRVWIGGKQDKKVYRWTDGTIVVNDYWDEVKEFKVSAVSWFASPPKCMTLAPADKTIFNFDREHAVWKETYCADSYPYVCEHGPFKMLVEELIISTGITTPTSETTTADQTTTTADQETTTDVKTSAAVPTTEAKPVRQTVQHLFVGVNNAGNPKLRAEPDDVYLKIRMIQCARVCVSDDRCELLNHFQPDTCALYFNANKALEKGTVPVRRSQTWRIIRF